jgi:hypothetical protein
MSTTLDATAASVFEPPPEAVDFYIESLKLLKESEIPFLLSGTYALACFTGITRPTKDLDVFASQATLPRSSASSRRAASRSRWRTSAGSAKSGATAISST